MSINILYTDNLGTCVRTSSVKQYDNVISFAPVSVKAVLSGTENYHFQKSVLRARKDKVIVGNVNTEARVVIDSKEDVQGVCIDFGSSIIDEFLLDSQPSQVVVDAILQEQFFMGELKPNNRNLECLITGLIKLINRPSLNDRVHEQLLLIIQSYFDIQQFRIQQALKLDYKRPQTKVNSFDFLLDTKFYIDNHFYQNIQLDQLSVQVGVSKFKLLRDFKSVFGITPHDYLISVRLQKAEDLLGKMPIQEIAHVVGFSDSSAFGKVFKSRFGITPLQFIAKK